MRTKGGEERIPRIFPRQMLAYTMYNTLQQVTAKPNHILIHACAPVQAVAQNNQPTSI